MDKTKASDPTEILPQALARMQERAIAEARRTAETAARDMVGTMLRKAITLVPSIVSSYLATVPTR